MSAASSTRTPSAPRSAGTRQCTTRRCRLNATPTNEVAPSARIIRARLLADHLARPAAVEEVDRAALVDVADEPAVDAVAHELAQPWRKSARDLERDPELLVLLLADPARAIVHGDADARGGGAVGAAAVPEAAVEHQHAAALHLGGDGVVGDAEVGRLVRAVRARHQPRGAVVVGEIG